MSEDQLSKYLTKYFKQHSVDKNVIARILQYAEQYAPKSSSQATMLGRIFHTAQQIQNNGNLKTVVKRYLHLVNELLEKDEKMMPQFRYQHVISGEIVGQFVRFLTMVVDKGLMDVFADMKMYRKRWAKRITDEAYNAMQVEALRQVKLDLDKGFSEENLDRLGKIYKQRKFTQVDLKKFMPGSNPSAQADRKKTRASSSSSEGRPAKRAKKQPTPDRTQRRTQHNNTDMVNARHSSLIPSSSSTNTYANSYANVRPGQALYHHPNYPSYLQPSFLPPPVPAPVPIVNYQPISEYAQQQQQQQQQANYYKQQNSSVYVGHVAPSGVTGTYGYPMGYQMQPGVYPSRYDYPSAGQYNRQSVSKKSAGESIRTRLQTMKYMFGYECKFCGLLISTHHKYQSHLQQHFLHSQRNYQITHSRTQHTRRPTLSLLPTPQAWINSTHLNKTQQKYQVPISTDKTSQNCNRNCVICQSELKITWSREGDGWVYENAVRTRARGEEGVCHAECYLLVEEGEGQGGA